MHQAIWVDLEDPRAQHNPFLARLQEFIANPEGEMAWREWVWIHYGASFEKALALSVPDRCFL